MPDPTERSSVKDTPRRERIFEVLDELIFHMNTTRNIFTLLIVSAFIPAPTALTLATVFIAHLCFMRVLMNRLPDQGFIILAYAVISIILASIWLFIGIKEQRFLSRWNKRFSRFISLKNQI
ncbi:MAG: hypothetical protein V3T40_00545 [Nitrososphaerales archaeon]